MRYARCISSFVFENDLPPSPSFEDEEIWFYMGEGHYRKLVGVNGKWLDKDHFYNQEES